MYKAEAELFLSANNNINSAKTLINECKRLISEAELPNNSDYANCKRCINDCDVNGLSEFVETTKEGLFRLDQAFAGEYMSLLQQYLQTDTIDTSNMSEEEQMQYNIQMNSYYKDYNYNLLYMLEKYEESGQLTPELKQQLEIQRTLVEQYKVQDEMSGLMTTDRDFIELYEENAKLDRRLIELTPNLSEEEKTAALNEYDANYGANLNVLILNHEVFEKTEELKSLDAGSEEYYEVENEIRELQIEYYENKGNLTADEQRTLAYLYDGVELNELYIDKERNSDFFHPFIENELDEAILDKKIEMGIATADEIAYDSMNGWERAWENTKTFTTSVVFGIGSVTETIIDGSVMIAGEVGSWFGADTQWADDFVSTCYATDAYSGIVECDFINSVSAYSGWHAAGNLVGTTVGYVGLAFLPGGKITTAVTGGLSAMGSSSERALNSGATWDEAMAVGTISGIAGAAAGYGVGGGLTSGAKNMTQVIGKTLLGGGIAAAEPIVNSGAEYFIYANDMVDENGRKIYSNVFDYYVEGGGLTNTMMAFVVGTVSSGFEAVTRRAPNYNNSQNIRNNCISEAQRLISDGHNPDSVVTYLTNYGENFPDYKSRRLVSNFCYEFLLANNYTPEAAGNILSYLYKDVLNARGMQTSFVDEFLVKYNTVNGMNYDNQAYSVQYIKEEIASMPPELRQSISNVNIYDTFNPADYYWHWKYGNQGTSEYFVSAATGGYGEINFWANSSIDSSTLYHEAGHCFDYDWRYSGSNEYLAAIESDRQLTGLASVTAYGANAPNEDFAESIAAYFGKNPSVNLDNFPNRKAYIAQLFEPITDTLADTMPLDIIDKLNGVYETLETKYGSGSAKNILYNYLNSGNINTITRTNNARQIISEISREDILSYYNMLNGEY